MKISINISHLFSMIAIIVADVYLGFEYKGNVILIVSYTFLMLYIVLDKKYMLVWGTGDVLRD